MPHFDSNRGRVFYRHWPTQTPPAATIVFLHGFGEHSGLYHRYAAELAAHGIELWALDQLGHGLSDGARGDVGSPQALVVLAHTLSDLAAAASPGVPQIIAGHSLGSLVALLAVLDEPDRFVAAVISGAPLTPLDWLTRFADGHEPDEPFALALDDLSSDPFYRNELENDPLAFTEADVVSILSAFFPPIWDRLSSELATVRLPILAVHGSDDTIAPIDGVTAWQSRIDRLQVVAIEGAAHDVLNETQHRRVADHVGAFVADRVGSGALR